MIGFRAVRANGVYKMTNDTPVTPPAPPPTPVQRFPGDPNPTVTKQFYWGASVGGNSPTTAHETAAGVPLGVHRTYFSSSQWDPTSGDSALLQQVRADHTANRLPMVSFKVTSWTTGGSGGYDAAFTSLITALESYAKPTWIMVHHEPENDGVAADWRALQVRFRARLTAYGTLHRVAFGGCLSAYDWNVTGNYSPDSYYCGVGVHDFYGGDHYSEKTEAIERSTQWSRMVNWVASKGMPLVVPEWGIRKEDTAGSTKIQSFYTDLASGQLDCVALCYFDSDLNSTGTGWSLNNTYGSLATFDSLVAAANSIHLSNLGY